MYKHMIIDTHAHLDMEQFEKDREEVIKRAQDNGVKLILNVGSTVAGSIRSVELADKYQYIYAAVGVHPHDVENTDEAGYKKIKSLIQHKKVIAVGEIGLDYYKNYSPKEKQRESFVRQLDMAIEANKPLIIHSRDAKEDTLSILKERKNKNLRGILHCFSGDQEMMEEAINLGFFISLAGQVTFPKAHSLQEIAKKIPTERLLLETDCPYLSPQPNRGKRNEPSSITHTIKKVAELRGVSPQDIERVVATNFSNLFNITLDAIHPEAQIAYMIRNSLYLNITNKCSNACLFCSKFGSYTVQGYNLKLNHEPSFQEITEAIGTPNSYDEIVFCGFGESTMRLDMVKTVGKWIKEKGGTIRLNTNGQGNSINNRNILPELQGIVDTISISLNAENATIYEKICQPVKSNTSSETYTVVCNFIREAKKYIPRVIATVIDMPDTIDVDLCKKIAEEDLGVEFRVRRYNMVGSH